MERTILAVSLLTLLVAFVLLKWAKCALAEALALVDQIREEE